ncbi:MAG: ComE operon protein 1 [Firmicutes bacterium]|nr:ComE operon protein 1 [candidate division NPL-UPA2 bacterium]
MVQWGAEEFSENEVLGVSRTVVMALACGLVLSLGLNILLYFQLQASPEVVYVDVPQGQAKPLPAQEPSLVVVHVTGAVARPSVYTLATGSRAVAAIEAAGGAQADADLERTNLARVLSDGEQLHIFRRGEQGMATSTPAPGGSSNPRINVNTATQAELETLPGIGPTRAAAIIAFRQQQGAFVTPEDLMKVNGIGTKTFEGLKDHVRVR